MSIHNGGNNQLNSYMFPLPVTGGMHSSDCVVRMLGH